MEMISNGNINYYVGGEGEMRPKTKIVCTLGPTSPSVEMFEKFPCAGMNVAIFNFSHGSHEYHQETLDNLRQAMENTGILCDVMLDTKVSPLNDNIAEFEIYVEHARCGTDLTC